MNNLWLDLVVRRSAGQRKDTGSVSRLDLVVILRRSACNRKDPGSVSRLGLVVSRSAGKAVHFVVPIEFFSHAKKSSRFLQGKQAATELRYPSACCWVFLCFRNPPNSVDIIMRAYTQGGRAHRVTDSESAHLLLSEILIILYFAPEGVQTSSLLSF